MPDSCTRQILPNVKDFKQFWKDKGPFKYALTSLEYPPVLLEPEEWIFGSDKVAVLRELMQFSKEKMAFVQAPFNPGNRSILRPQDMSPWKINHFPEDWNGIVCTGFVPEGHLTSAVTEEVKHLGLNEDKAGVEAAFFSLIEQEMETMGYVLIVPKGKSRFASTRAYLEEWETDEQDAGIR